MLSARAVRAVVSGGARSLRATADGVVASSSRPSGRSPPRCSRGAAARGAARVLLAPAVPPHPVRWCGARPPLLCGGGSCSLRAWSSRSSGGRRRAALAAPLHAAPLVCSSRPPCRRIRCGVVALGRRFSAAEARALSVVRVVVGGGARSLRASADEVVAFFGRSPSRWARGAAARGAARALLAPAVPPHPMRRGGARPPLLCGGSSCSQRGTRRGWWWPTLSACGRRRGRRVLRGGRRRAALAAPLHAVPLVRSSRPPCRRIRCGVVALGRRSSAAAACALNAVRVVVSGGARSLRAAADEVVAFFGGRRRTALETPLHAVPLVRSSHLPCRRFQSGVVALGRRSSAAAARALSARGASRGRLRRVPSACGRWRGRRVLRGGRRCAALAAPLRVTHDEHHGPAVPTARSQCRRANTSGRVRGGFFSPGRRRRCVVGGAFRTFRNYPECHNQPKIRDAPPRLGKI